MASLLYWRVSSEEDYDWLEFYIDDVRQDRISGSSASWQLKSYNVEAEGKHTFKEKLGTDRAPTPATVAVSLGTPHTFTPIAKFHLAMPPARNRVTPNRCLEFQPQDSTTISTTACP